jgi:mono/diheme cytochrome c family protein
MVTFERKLPMEEIDTAEIVRGILKVQAQYAAAENRPLGRGTHTKGVCAHATFEVFNLSQKIADPSLAKRLAQGIFAKPGIYPATVRFANAASTIYSDRKPDLRAMSFSVELPPEMAGQSPYQDYSLQSKPTFPINDAHTFAVVMKVLSAGSSAKMFKALLALPIMDQLRVLKAKFIGTLQAKGKIQGYQKFRFWSTVPFRNGPFEAVMFSAIPNEDNPAHEILDEPNALRDELIQHLNEDERMSSWDFALQLLDSSRMTRWGFHRSPSFWVENATVEWKESQAPFNVVGRLKLVPKSALEIGACEPQYIDVTEHSTPESQPLGSVNRARWASETASRKVRRGEATADQILETLPSAPPIRHSLAGALLRFAALSLFGVLLLYFTTDVIYSFFARRNALPTERIDATRYLDQGWGLYRESPGRELYYYTGQGSGIHGIRYSWFANLERPFHQKRFADPDHMRSLDFVVDPAATPANPDQLPVGFARRYDPTINDDVVDITCAACHTGQLNVTDKKTGQTTAIRIDGGESMAAFTDVKAGSFQVEIGAAVAETLANPLKFNRFANRVLGTDSNTLRAKFKLWRNMAGVSMELGKTLIGSSGPWHYPVQEGYGRTDALTRIGNVVFGDHITSKNYHVGNAPVSYPHLWNIWKFNWVQYNASVSEPLARNVNESLGVGAKFQFVDDYGRPVPEDQRYQTSVAFENLARIEAKLQELKPPRWDDTNLQDLLPPISKESADRGQKLFNDRCARCHGPHIASQALKDFASPGRLPSDPMWDIRTVNLEAIGTDPTEANNFLNYRVDLTRTGITFDQVMPMLKAEMETQKARYAVLVPALKKEIAAGKRPGVDEVKLDDYTKQLEEMEATQVTDASIAQKLGELDMRALNAGDALNMVGMIIRHKFYSDHNITFESDGQITGAAHGCFAGFDALDIPQVTDAYKPRPLEGVWATPPFLHNGSVPNLYDLLSPVEERNARSKIFYVGSREFDPVKVGYVTEPPAGTHGGFWLDTTKTGNHNTGHEFREGYIPYNPDPKAPKSPPGVIGPPLSPQDRMDIIEYLKIHRDSPGTADRTPVDCVALLKK